MAKILIITDSRGVGLQQELRSIRKSEASPVGIEVVVLRGANLDNGYDKLENEMDMDKRFNLIYVMLGVNNLTRKIAKG